MKMTSIYNNLAYYYDRLMSDVDYGKWALYVENIFKVNDAAPRLVLDLGCGTGSFCIEMVKRGYEMIGVDISCEMLSCARKKCDQEGVDILFLNQDMRNLKLHAKVDAVVCLMDSINYLTETKDVLKLFRLVENYLKPSGLFIFDINTDYKFETVLANNVYYSIEEEIAYIWQNNFDKNKKVCEFDLTFFVKDKNNFYRRFDEVHFERSYSIDELTLLVTRAGLQLVSIYDGLSFSSPSDKSERVFFVCTK